MKTEYKRNGAGDIFRKKGKKVECFFRGRWASSITNDVWDLPVLKSISEEQALKESKNMNMIHEQNGYWQRKGNLVVFSPLRGSESGECAVYNKESIQDALNTVKANRQHYFTETAWRLSITHFENGARLLS